MANGKKGFIATAQLQAVKDAENLPNLKITKGKRTKAIEELIKGSRLVMKNWQALKAYIEKAFAPEVVPAIVESAGGSLYNLVNKKN